MMAINVALLLHQRWRVWQRRAPRRAIERARPTTIASLQEGVLTKIIGVIAPRAPMLMSAVSKQSCIGYTTAVEAPQETGWRPAVVEGDIVIAPHPDIGWEAPPASLLPQRDDDSWLPSLRPTVEGENRYREILLKPGDRVSVLGRAKMEIDPAGRSSFREPPMLNHITGSEDAPVIVAHDMITLS